MSSKGFYLKILIIILIISNAVCISLFFQKPEVEILSDYCYLEDTEYILIEKNNLNAFDEGLTSYLYKNKEDDYISKLIKGTEDELVIDDLIKEGRQEEFRQKIEELLALKYPKFISDELVKENVKKSYLLRDNELVIYYNDYNITPDVNEVLYLKVNYNEIKDYINFTLTLDSDYENESGYNYTNAKKAVAITFDDSPNKNKTNKILTSLKDNLSHATFFVVGVRAKNNVNLLENIKNGGNEIGTHTYNHQNIKKLTDKEIEEDFAKMNELYKSVFNEDLKYFRPPYGSMKQSTKNLLDVSYIMWSLDTNDWRYRNSDYLVNYVIDNIKDGDIILFHDAYDTTVKAVQELLPILYSKGYQVMSVSELFALKNIPLNSHEIYYRAS